MGDARSWLAVLVSARICVDQRTADCVQQALYFGNEVGIVKSFLDAARSRATVYLASSFLGFVTEFVQ